MLRFSGKYKLYAFHSVSQLETFNALIYHCKNTNSYFMVSKRNLKPFETILCVCVCVF